MSYSLTDNLKSVRLLRRDFATSMPGLDAVKRSEKGSEVSKSPEFNAVKTDGESSNYAWILHPAIDILFVCGGITWLLFAVHFFIAKPTMNSVLLQSLGFAVLIATHLLSETHTVATLVRAYKNGEERRRLSLYTEWGALACLALFFLGLFVNGFTPILAKVYLLWVVHHFSAQSYGLALLYCLKRKYDLASWEKKILQSIFSTAGLYAIVRQMSFEDWSPNGFLALNIPYWGPLPTWCLQVSTILLVSSVVLFGFISLRKFFLSKKFLPLPTFLITLTTILIFTLGHDSSSIVWLYVPAFFHGAQYLVISFAQYIKERGIPTEVQPNQIAKLVVQSDGLKYLGFLIMGAIVIYIGLPRLLSEFGFTYTHAFATVFCAVNLHHFITDQAIWKLRNPKLRSQLVH